MFETTDSISDEKDGKLSISMADTEVSEKNVVDLEKLLSLLQKLFSKKKISKAEMDLNPESI